MALVINIKNAVWNKTRLKNKGGDEVTDDRKKIIVKIQKLLALGDTNKNTSKEEAKAALEMARDCMDRHNLSMSEVEVAGIKDGNISHILIDKAWRIMKWEKLLAKTVCIVCGTDVIIQAVTKHKAKLMFVGMKKDVSFSMDLFYMFAASIKSQALKRFPKVKKKESVPDPILDPFGFALYRRQVEKPIVGQTKLRNDYLYCFSVYLMLAAIEQKTRNEVVYSRCKALVTVKKNEIEKYIKNELKPDGEDKVEKVVCKMARLLARKDATKFDLQNKKKIGG